MVSARSVAKDAAVDDFTESVAECPTFEVIARWHIGNHAYPKAVSHEAHHNRMLTTAPVVYSEFVSPDDEPSAKLPTVRR
jgi:hypothetical protein